MKIIHTFIKQVRTFLLIIFGLGMVALAVILTIGLMFWTNSESIERSDVALSTPPNVTIPTNNLPNSATDFYFLEHVGGLQSLQSFLRFRVPLKDVDSAVETLISENRKGHGEPLASQRQSLDDHEMGQPAAEFQPVQWWKSGSISKGYYRGEMESYAIQIWADTETGIIYVRKSD